MGGWLSSMLGWEPALPNLDTTPDPGSGLSELDRHLIKSTWALASDKKVIRENGVELFVQIFKAYPYMQKMFPQFEGMDAAALRKSTKMKAHGVSVMYAIGNYVENLEDADMLVALVEKIAVSHVRRDIGVKEFEDLHKIFIPYLRTLLGDGCTPEIEAAWNKLLSAQTAIVGNVVKEEAENQ